MGFPSRSHFAAGERLLPVAPLGRPVAAEGSRPQGGVGGAAPGKDRLCLQHGQAHRFGQQRLLLRIGRCEGGNRARDVIQEFVLASRAAGAQHVQADARHHGGQPGAQILDVVRAAAVEPQPGFLDGIVGFARCAQHAIGNRPQVRPVPFKLFRQTLIWIAGHISPLCFVIPVTNTNRSL
jgi:hypothetical protein